MKSEHLPALQFDDSPVGTPIKISGTIAELGAVAFLWHPATRSVCLVEKAKKANYNFSEMLVLPGGMCRRSSSTKSIDEEIAYHLNSRVTKETGLNLNFDNSRPFQLQEIPVTSYLVDGLTKYVAVLVFCMRIDGPLPLAATADRSITNARWHDIEIPWLRVAPANRLIISSILSTRLTPEAIEQAGPSLSEARDLCTDWCKKSGVCSTDLRPSGIPFSLD